MPHEKSNQLEYSADYRTHGGQAKRATVRANTKAKVHYSRATGEETPAISTDTIAISKPTKRKLGLYRILFACVMMILAIAGITTLISALNRTALVMNTSSTNAKYSNYIAPVVMHDPSPFEDSTHIDTSTKIASSIWRNIFQKGTSAYKDFDEEGRTLMSTNDIQTACTELFGPTATISTSENINGQFFSFVPGEDFFHISATSNASSFVPYIDDITQNNDILSLAVSYLSRDDKYFSTGEDKTEKPTPLKHMVYNLKLNEATNKYYIQSVANP